MRLPQTFALVLVGCAFTTLVAGAVAGWTLWVLRDAATASGMTPGDLDVLLTRGLWIIGVATTVGLVASLGAAGWLHRSVARAIDRLHDAIDRLRTGRLNTRVDIAPDDTLGGLAQALNSMSATLSRETVSRSYLHNVLDSMNEMLFVTRSDGTIMHANRAAAAMLDTSSTSLRGRPLADLFDDAPPDDLNRADDAPTERVLTRPGGDVPVLVSHASLLGSDASAPEVVWVAQDISVRKAAEERLRASLEEKDVLLREIHHRVKNNLQVISSLLHVQAKKVADADARRLFEESQDRIRSMAAIHEQLYQSDDLSRVPFGEYLHTLADHLIRSHRSAQVTCTVDADATALTVDHAVPAGLIVNELVSNALKHAFPDGADGTIQIAFHVDNGTGTLRVSDDGVGTPDISALDGAGGGSSLGVRLVHGLARQIDGTVTFDIDDGVCATVTFPVAPDRVPTADVAA